MLTKKQYIKEMRSELAKGTINRAISFEDWKAIKKMIAKKV